MSSESDKTRWKDPGAESSQTNLNSPVNESSFAFKSDQWELLERLGASAGIADPGFERLLVRIPARGDIGAGGVQDRGEIVVIGRFHAHSIAETDGALFTVRNAD